ncbi:MAG: HAMP domain-containing histidine kinase, partial [Desulfobulbaceae bacterium]|nr:HAMP domain-containing histidine kinase [Desulfobulbaceae bacterium]
IFIKSGEFSAENEAEKTWIEVRDTGAGIPDKIKNKIFDPFFTTRENGTGLGLAIVRQIVKSHGGEIRVASKEGEGTSFVIKLPLPPTPGSKNL